MFLAVDDNQHNTEDRAEAAASDYQRNLPVKVEHKKNNPGAYWAPRFQVVG